MKTVAIEDAFVFVRNGLSIKQEDGKKGIPITRIETIWNSNIDKDRFGFADITEEKLKDVEKYLLNEGDILMTHINSPKHLGKCAIYNNDPEKLIHGMNLLCMRPKAEVLFPKYALYFFNSARFRAIIPRISNQSVNQASFSAGNLKEIQIPLPPLATQQKIAAILDAAKAYRQKTKTLIAKYDQLAQSLFLDMFGDPVRNEKGWEKVKFEELVSKDCPLTYGIVQPGEETENGIPCVRPVDLTTQYVNVETLKRIDPKISGQFKRTILKGGEILLSVRGSVGVISIADLSLKGSNVTRGIVPIWFDEIISNKFFFFYLYKTDRIQIQIKGLAKGATLIQINLSDLRSIELIKPPITLQNQFAERIQLIEAQKQQAQASLQKAENLFNSLLQRAFKGELVS
jgi:type I restriction enzyme S subunit